MSAATSQTWDPAQRHTTNPKSAGPGACSGVDALSHAGFDFYSEHQLHVINACVYTEKNSYWLPCSTSPECWGFCGLRTVLTVFWLLLQCGPFLLLSVQELLVPPGSWPRPSLPSPPSVMSCWQRERGRGMNIYTNTTNRGSCFARTQTLSPCHLLIRNVMISQKSPLWWILSLKVCLFHAWTLPQLFIFLFRDDFFLLHLLVKYINIHGADYKMLQCVFLKCYLTTLCYLQITKMS